MSKVDEIIKKSVQNSINHKKEHDEDCQAGRCESVIYYDVDTPYASIEDYYGNNKSLNTGFFKQGMANANKEDVLEFIDKIGFRFANGSEEYDDSDSRPAVRATYSTVLEFCEDKSFKNDKEIILKALISGEPEAIGEASYDIRADRQFMLEAINLDGNSFKHGLFSISDDKELALLAIRKNPIMIEYASDRLKNDKHVVYEAVKTNPSLIESASDEIYKLVGYTNPAENLQKAINAENLHSRLNMACTPKAEPQARRMKI
jgi:hypothetical protein